MLKTVCSDQVVFRVAFHGIFGTILFAGFGADVIGATTSESQQFAPASSLSVSAKNTAAANTVLYHWVTSWGSYERDFFTQQDVEIEAHNLNRLPAKIAVDFYFIGQLDFKPEPRLFSRRTFDIEVMPGYQKRVSLRSDILKSNETRYVALGYQYNSGYHIAGWLLQARLPTELTPFVSVSSTPTWVERMDWFAPALAEFRRQVKDDSATPNHRSQSPSPLPSRRTDIQTPPANSVEHRPTTSSDSMIVLTSDVRVQLQYGQMTLRKGTRLIVVSRTRDFVSALCGNEAVEIPFTDTQPN